MKEVLSSILFLAIAGGLLWGWDSWQKRSEEARGEAPSIGALATVKTIPVAAAEDVASEISAPTEEKKPNASEADKGTLDVKVLNGGAAKGSAVKVQDFLKKAGYAKTKSSSSIGDYTGTTVYYLGSNESSATAIQQLLLKDYPKAEVKIATSSTAENGSAPVVVILGK